MRENEAEYAVSFAIPVATKGVHLICRPGRGERSPAEFPSNRPTRGLIEAMIVFDNVFVPWDRVFLCGEWQYSMLLAYTFATYHRFTAVSYKIPIVEIMAGIALADGRSERPGEGAATSAASCRRSSPTSRR